MTNKHRHLWSFDRYELDPGGRAFLKDGEPVPLEPKEFDLLAYMVKNARRVLTKRELMDHVWEDVAVEESRLTGVVFSIRRKAFGDADKEYIVTVRNQGYRFDADVDEPHVPDEACPWVGLRAFDEKQAEHFFGRDKEVRALVQRLEGEKIIAIVGSSGRGKSSLARAGVMPAVRGTSTNVAEWKVTALRPAHSPLSQLSVALLELTRSRPSKQETEMLAKRLAASSAEMSDYLLNSGAGRPARVLLVIDQFEQVFSARVRQAEREAFIANIVAGVQATDVDVYLILTIRTDFLQKIEDYPLLWSLVSDHQHGVRRFSREDLRLAIEGPAAAADLELEEGLADEILDDLGEAPGALPLLSHTMAELFKQRDGVRLTFKSYRAIGKVKGAIAHHADHVFSSLTTAEQEIARNVLIRLTDVGLRPGSDAALRLTLDELVTADPQRAGDVRQVIKKLSDERLLTTDSEGEISDPADEGQVWVEVSHVALIQHWPLLLGWLNEKRYALRIFHSMDADAKRWEAEGRAPEFLYQDHRLTQALEARLGYEEFIEDVHRDFLQASQALMAEKLQEEKRRIRRRRKVRWLYAGLALTAVVAVLIYVDQQRTARNLQLTERQRDLANSLRWAADSITQQPLDPEISLLLAIESGNLALTSQTESSLRQALAAPRVQVRYVGHQSQIISVDLSPDGRFLLTGALDKEARIWDVDTGQLVRKIGPLPERINWADYSPDGSKVVTASSDGAARVWDAGTGTLLKELRPQPSKETQSVNHAIFSPDGRYVLTGGQDGLPRLWDFYTGAVVRDFKGNDKETYVNTVAYSPNGKLIGAASGDGIGRVWDAQTGRLLGTLTGHQGSVLYISFNSDGSKILSTGKDGTARVWEVNTWKELLKITGHSLQVNSAEFSRDGKIILTSGHDGTARVWDAGTGAEVLEFLGHASAINSAIFSADGRRVFTASGDFTARAWALDAPQMVAEMTGHSGVVYSSSFSPDSQRVVTAGGDHIVRVWEARTGRPIMVIDHPGQAQRAIFSPDGTSILTAGDDGAIRVWDAASGRLRRAIVGDKIVLHSISISHDGTMAVTGGADGAARVWDLRTGNVVKEVQAVKRETVKRDKFDVYDAQFSPDARSIATAGIDNRVVVWDISSGEVTFQWNVGTGAINSVSFSPDGQSLLAACNDGTARVWDLQDKKAVAVLRGHARRATSASFSSNGALILTSSDDQTVRLWEMGARRTLLQFRRHTSPIMYSSFSSDGRLIAAADAQGNVSVSTCEICGATGVELLSLAKRHKTRDLTLGERERFLRLSR